MKRISGISVSPFSALGILRFHRQLAPCKQREEDALVSADEALRRFRAACRMAEEELTALSEQTAKRLGDAEGEIFAVQAMLVSDPDFTEAVEQAIEKGHSLPNALDMGCETICALLQATQDDYLMKRQADMRDITDRIRVSALGSAKHGQTDARDGAEDSDFLPIILAAHELPPSATATIDPQRIVGLMEEEGSIQGHTAILARTLGIAAVAGLGTIPGEYEGHRVLIRGDMGEIILDPDEAEIDAYEADRQRRKAYAKTLDALRGKESITRDGKAIRLYANAATPNEIRAALASDAEGIGLLRSEVLFLGADHAPSEEEQLAFYRECLSLMAGRPIILRTLDIGADKIPSYLPQRREINPALGLRAIRHSLTYPDLLRTQLRAILRASAEGELLVMFPLITTAEEIKEAKALLNEVKNELAAKGIPHSLPRQIGIMIETPAAALTADLLAREVDFFSIGSNDLAQYTLAADRQDPLLSARYPLSPLPPALIRLIAFTVQCAHEAGIWCGLCGELGSEPAQIKCLLDLGLDELSVLPSSLLSVRHAIRQHTKSPHERNPLMSLFSKHRPEATLLAPCDGRLIPLESVPDEAFAKKLLGDGFAIRPSGETLFAPCDGRIQTISDCGHAITLVTEDGMDLLLHIGVDTVSLGTAPFHPQVAPGDTVKAGEPLLHFDRKAIEEAALPTDVILIVTDREAISSFVTECGEATGGKTIAAHYVKQ